jgi:hypothetical protein
MWESRRPLLHHLLLPPQAEVQKGARPPRTRAPITNSIYRFSEVMVSFPRDLFEN